MHQGRDSLLGMEQTGSVYGKGASFTHFLKALSIFCLACPKAEQLFLPRPTGALLRPSHALCSGCLDGRLHVSSILRLRAARGVGAVFWQSSAPQSSGSRGRIPGSPSPGLVAPGPAGSLRGSTSPAMAGAPSEALVAGTEHWKGDSFCWGKLFPAAEAEWEGSQLGSFLNWRAPEQECE